MPISSCRRVRSPSAPVSRLLRFSNLAHTSCERTVLGEMLVSVACAHGSWEKTCHVHCALVLWTSPGLQQCVEHVNVKCAADCSDIQVHRCVDQERRQEEKPWFTVFTRSFVGTVETHCCSGRLCNDEVSTLASRRSPEQHSDSSETCHLCAMEGSFPDPHPA